MVVTPSIIEISAYRKEGNVTRQKFPKVLMAHRIVKNEQKIPNPEDFLLILTMATFKKWTLACIGSSHGVCAVTISPLNILR